MASMFICRRAPSPMAALLEKLLHRSRISPASRFFSSNAQMGSDRKRNAEDEDEEKRRRCRENSDSGIPSFVPGGVLDPFVLDGLTKSLSREGERGGAEHADQGRGEGKWKEVQQQDGVAGSGGQAGWDISRHGDGWGISSGGGDGWGISRGGGGGRDGGGWDNSGGGDGGGWGSSGDGGD